MTMMKTILAGGAGIAALAAAAPAAAQYGYGYNPYAYGSPYGYNVHQMAAQRCTAAVQARLNNRTSGGILGAIFGFGTQTNGRVLSVTQIDPDRTEIQVRGLASSGRMAYNPYGIGAYGALGWSYQPDLRFRCDVDYRGYIRDIDIDRR